LKATKAPVAVNLRFPGQYFDEEANLSYNYFRSYDSRTGRYTRPDPIGLDGGLNQFIYVGGNPLSYVDPDGRNALLFLGGLALTAYGTYATFRDLQKCKKTCEMTQGDAVQACELDRRDIVDADKGRRIAKCKAGCALTSIFDIVWQNYSMPK
jgi:RHS repeat-associated protein